MLVFDSSQVATARTNDARNRIKTEIDKRSVWARIVGTDPELLADFTQLNPIFVKETVLRFEAAGRWDRLRSETAWFEDYATPFWLEVYEATGAVF